MDIVEGMAPSEKEKAIMQGVRARNAGALATWDSFVPPVGERRKTLDDGDHVDCLKPAEKAVHPGGSGSS